MSPTSISQPALYQEVAERLRQRIFSHELQPGAWVDEQALAVMVMSLLLVWRHEGNIRKLLAGTESKIGQKAAPAASAAHAHHKDHGKGHGHHPPHRKGH